MGCRTITPLEWKSSDAMRTVITLLYCLFATTSVKADVLWPTIPHIEIVSCKDGDNGPCSTQVMYEASPTQFVRLPENVGPTGQYLKVIAYGVHCRAGSKPGQFNYCQWLPQGGYGHSPTQTSECRLSSPTSWKLTENSTCMVSSKRYGAHTGAGPGSECVVFGLDSYPVPAAIQTPIGPLTAAQVANGGDTYCIKPLPPAARCDLVIIDDGVLDHGIVAPDSTSKRSTTLYMNCGDSPKFSLQGINGNKVTLGTGVTANITTSIVNKSQATLTSVLTTTNAQPGNYRATFVLIVSPN